MSLVRLHARYYVCRVRAINGQPRNKELQIMHYLNY